MASCKDCLYSEKCITLIMEQPEEICPNFKDRSRFVELPCEIGNMVNVITNCCNIYTYNDNDYSTGTGATECPFEDNCNFEECDDTNERIFETTVSSIYNEGNGWYLAFKDLAVEFNITDIGKTVFLTPEEAEKALKERVNNEQV